MEHLKDITLPQDKQLFTTILGGCASSLSDAYVDTVGPCSHKETSTRLFLHEFPTTIAVHHRVIVRTSIL